MAQITIYNALTGEIDRTGTAPESMLFMQCNAGELLIAGRFDGRDHYVLDGFPVLRPIRPIIADGAAPLGLDLSWRVDGSTITIHNQDGDSMEVAAATLTLVDPGQYLLEVTQPFPHHTFRQRIIVS